VHGELHLYVHDR